MTSHAWMRLLRELARQYGRDIEQGGKHLKLTCPRGERPMVCASRSPSCSHSEQNLKAQLRRAETPIGD